MTESSPAPPRRVVALGPPELRAALGEATDALGLELVWTATPGGLFGALSRGRFLAAVVSLSVEGVDEPVARRIGESPESGSLILTSPGVSLDQALVMERSGAVALVREPLDPDELLRRLEAVAEEGAEVPLPPLPAEGDAPAMVGSSPAMAGIFETVARVAATPSTVLVTGESGTGKEVLARTLHDAGDRRDGPFVAVNCAAIPEHLLESELFGHEEGAFTGAVRRRTGRFERAQGGTLFLDEIGDMSLVLQAKILRVLEERVVERVGGEATVSVDVRVVAATNQDLARRMEEGEFREDLYYRLAVVELHLPPLRDRGDDIRTLALHFGSVFAHRYGRPVRAVTEEALRRLQRYPWPGNVRELRNVMDRAVLLSPGEVLGSGSLRLGAGAPRGSARASGPGVEGYPPSLSLQEVEASHIRRVLSAHDGHMGRTAEVLGIHRNTLTRKVQEYGIGEGGASGSHDS